MKRGDSSSALDPRTTRLGTGFWDEVEREIEALDWRDLAEFLEADAGPHDPPAELRDRLRESLRSFVKTRYGQ